MIASIKDLTVIEFKNILYDMENFYCPDDFGIELTEDCSSNCSECWFKHIVLVDGHVKMSELECK